MNYLKRKNPNNYISSLILTDNEGKQKTQTVVNIKKRLDDEKQIAETRTEQIEKKAIKSMQN